MDALVFGGRAAGAAFGADAGGIFAAGAAGFLMGFAAAGSTTCCDTFTSKKNGRLVAAADSSTGPLLRLLGWLASGPETCRLPAESCAVSERSEVIGAANGSGDFGKLTPAGEGPSGFEGTHFGALPETFVSIYILFASALLSEWDKPEEGCTYLRCSFRTRVR